MLCAAVVLVGIASSSWTCEAASALQAALASELGVTEVALEGDAARAGTGELCPAASPPSGGRRRRGLLQLVMASLAGRARSARVSAGVLRRGLAQATPAAMPTFRAAFKARAPFNQVSTLRPSFTYSALRLGSGASCAHPLLCVPALMRAVSSPPQVSGAATADLERSQAISRAISALVSSAAPPSRRALLSLADALAASSAMPAGVSLGAVESPEARRRRVKLLKNQLLPPALAFLKCAMPGSVSELTPAKFLSPHAVSSCTADLCVFPS